MRKQTNRVFSILLTLVMLLSLLPMPAQAGLIDELPGASGSFFSDQPQDGTALKTEGYPISWETVVSAPVVVWMYLNPNSLKWEAGGVLKKNPATLSYNQAHCLANGTATYKLLAEVNSIQHESEPFQVT